MDNLNNNPVAIVVFLIIAVVSLSAVIVKMVKNKGWGLEIGILVTAIVLFLYAGISKLVTVL